MRELLIEIFSEEIPARMQAQAATEAQKLFMELLTEKKATFENVFCHVSPQRLVLVVDKLAGQTADLMEERRGPRANAPAAALEGFLKSTNLSQEQLIEKDGYLYAHVHQNGQRIESLLPDILNTFLDKMPWPKSMRWYNPETQNFTKAWVRPIRSILCVYDGSPIIFSVKDLAITTGNTTQGHRFLAPAPLAVTSFTDYQNRLEKAHVIINADKRKNLIRQQLQTLCNENGLLWSTDEGLLQEVTGLVEYPFVYLRPIDSQFMHLPADVLSTSMRVHQKYFTLTTKGGDLAPYFGVVTNVPSPGENSKMMRGLERVLRARLTDAIFFYEADLANPLEAFRQKFNAIIFHEKLGSLGQKIDRLESYMETHDEKQAAVLCKADLLTQMVGEFPELQGRMGEHYALKQGVPLCVAKAIKEHYQPLGPNDVVPSGDISQKLALYDKLDTLVGFMGVGIKPTGSKDPYALRRAALGIIRIVIENALENIDLCEKILPQIIAAYKNQNISLSSDTIKETWGFLMDRLKYALRAKGIDGNSFEAAALFGSEIAQQDIYRLAKVSESLSDFLRTESGTKLLKAYKRAVGIFNGKVYVSNLVLSDIDWETKEEKILNDILAEIKDKITEYDKENDFNGLLEALSELSDPINDFFDNVYINDPDKKDQRLSLLNAFIAILTQQAHFGVLIL